ncbi:MAG: hypothetical protein A2580_09185 [Hydrogenophilales bacterium RIFOXYD1_FULL_62_11]|nr:MAG: hypothetical protein A2580_09185 [Hydrogenophilales bacterium RIFOXYD1_FULL_62_11]
MQGRVLDLRDPRAWRGTVAFPSSSPDPDAVNEYVDRLLAEGEFSTVPVLWDLPSGQQVYWQRPASLRTYAQDYTHWLRARCDASERRDDRLEVLACAV